MEIELIGKIKNSFLFAITVWHKKVSKGLTGKLDYCLNVEQSIREAWQVHAYTANIFSSFICHQILLLISSPSVSRQSAHL